MAFEMGAQRLLLALPAASHAAPALELVTPRGAPIEVLAERPPGKGPSLRSCSAPARAITRVCRSSSRPARALVRSGVAVYRFNWAYYVRDPAQGKQSASRADEIEDMQTVISAARSASWVDASAPLRGRKVARLDHRLARVPIRSSPGGRALAHTGVQQPSRIRRFRSSNNYPDLLAEQRPVQWILGDRDPACEPRALYRFLAGAPRPHRVALLSGNHYSSADLRPRRRRAQPRSDKSSSPLSSRPNSSRSRRNDGGSQE